METHQNDFPPHDKWRLYVDSLPKDPSGSIPEALITLEFVIRRRIVIPTDLNTDGRIERSLIDLGIADVAAILPAIRAMPPIQRQFVSADWTDALDGQFSDESLTILKRLSSGLITWRLEGDPSPSGAMIAVLSCNGYEQRLVITRDNVAATEKKWLALGKDAEVTLANGSSSKDERQAASLTLKLMACIIGTVEGYATKNPKVILGAVVACTAAYDQMMAAVEEAKKREAEKAAKEYADSTGRADVDHRAGENDFRRAGKGFIG